MKPTEPYDVIVIGGGAAGMFCAGVAGSRGKRVLLIEKNRRLGEKLRITGGSRCNITNAEDDLRALLAQYGDAEQFLFSAFSQFGVPDTFRFFEERGLPLKVEARKRAFPHTEKAADVARVLTEYLAAGNVTIATGSAVTEVRKAGNLVTAVVAGGKTYTAASYVLSTGGVSHPETGSTGDGFRWLSNLGHTVKQPTPTIVPLRTKDSWVKQLAGKSVPEAKLTFFVDGKKAFMRTGPVLFTHFGISGPTVLNAAGDVADLIHEGQVTATIDTYPGMDLGILDRHIMRVFDENKNKLLRNVFKEIAPPGTTDVLLSLVAIDSEKKVHSVTKEERRMLAELLKALPLSITGLMGLERAVVADGGVLLPEVDMRTMRSRRVDNLFIIGDLLDITRPSGGYSLQLCWTTGFVGGVSA